ncbi:transposase [Streptomyces violaceorubidus]|uniref:Transposase n=1 Tax=Streptomyces violaceorubidus TaxID=284042 RepID=A0ABV1T6H6_9ACTN
MVDAPVARALRQCRVRTGRLPPVPGEGRLHPHRRPQGLLPPARSLRHPVGVQSRAADPKQLSRYALRAAAESTISEFVNGHGMLQCRYRSQNKAHVVQHVLTAIAVDLERIDVHLPPARPGIPGLRLLSRASSTGSTSPAPILARCRRPRGLN